LFVDPARVNERASLTVTIGAAPIGIGDVVRIARDGARVMLAPQARARVAAARAVVERLAQSAAPIYGVNSALGANTGQRLAGDDLVAYQARAVRARAVGVGPAYPAESVRAMMAARIAGMAAGGSGVSPAVLDALIELLNRDVHPIVPRVGSIGAGDLPQLAHLALPLIGEGEAEYRGEILPGAEALARAGLAPVALGAKDGLALISANAATGGRAALVLHEAGTLFDAWLTAVALSYEGFRANVSVLDARAVRLRAGTREEEIAAQLRARLEGSTLARDARRLQDPLSFRVAVQVHGAGQWMLDEATGLTEVELNSAADSPVVLASDDAMLSNGNFHTAALALAVDALALACAQMASLAVGRITRFMSPALTDLPLQLTRHGPAHSGFATLQKTAAALLAEIRHDANPGSLDFLPVSEGIEDHAPMTPGVVEKLAHLLVRVRYLIAIEQVVAAQAIDLRALAPDALGRGVREAYAAVRSHVDRLEEDRPLGPEVDRFAQTLGAHVAPFAP
jgi:histidine ammonia-lyase